MGLVQDQHGVVCDQPRLAGTHSCGGAIATEQEPTAGHVRRCTDHLAGDRVVLPSALRRDPAAERCHRARLPGRRDAPQGSCDSAQRRLDRDVRDLGELIEHSLGPGGHVVNERSAPHHVPEATRGPGPFPPGCVGHGHREDVHLQDARFASARGRNDGVRPASRRHDLPQQSTLPGVGLTAMVHGGEELVELIDGDGQGRLVIDVHDRSWVDPGMSVGTSSPQPR